MTMPPKMAPGEGGACDREAAPRVAEGVLGVGAVVGFGATVDSAGDVVAWFERGRGADCFHSADDSSPRIFRWAVASTVGMGVRGSKILPYLWRILMVLGFIYAKLCRRGSGEAGRSGGDEAPAGGC